METLHWWLPLGLRQRRSRWFIKRANYSLLVSNSRPKYQRTKFAKPITRRPKPSNLRTSPRAPPPGVKYGFITGEAIRLLRTNSPKEILAEGLLKFKQRLKAGEYLENITSPQLLRIHKSQKVTTYHSAVKILKQISMKHWSQPLLKAIFTKLPVISFKKGKSRLWEEKYNMKVMMRRDDRIWFWSYGHMVFRRLIQ